MRRRNLVHDDNNSSTGYFSLCSPCIPNQTASLLFSIDVNLQCKRVHFQLLGKGATAIQKPVIVKLAQMPIWGGQRLFLVRTWSGHWILTQVYTNFIPSFSGVSFGILDAAVSLRTFAALWLLFAIVVDVTYTSNLMSMLAVPDNSLPINVSCTVGEQFPMHVTLCQYR